VVTDRNGAPVTNLNEEDFEISEGGKRQKIASFQPIMLDGGLMLDPGDQTAISSDEVAAEEAARDDVRLFTIFLDDYHVSAESSRIVREQLSRFVETQLGPSDMVGVMYPLTPLASITMTRNHAKVVKLLQQFEGRRGDHRPRNAIEEGYVYKVDPGLIEGIRNEVVFSALKGLAMHMGALKEGRQTLILVAEGYASADRSKLLLSLRDVADVASRYNTAIYPVSPSILAPAGQWMPNNSMDSLNFLALHSGGRAIFDQTRTGAEYRERHETFGLPRSQLTLAMKQMVIDASVFYLIGYNSATVPDDKFHKIDVKVNRRGLEVRHREGYWAVKRS
jgi:VWFA-related protein